MAEEDIQNQEENTENKIETKWDWLKWLFNTVIIKHLGKWVIFALSCGIAYGGYNFSINKQTGEFGCSSPGLKGVKENIGQIKGKTPLMENNKSDEVSIPTQ